MAKPWHRGRWNVVRPAVLARDGYACQLRIPGVCTGIATQVDHIVSPLDGGAYWDDDNLRASCKSCNVHRGNVDQARRRRQQLVAAGKAAPLVAPSRAW